MTGVILRCPNCGTSKATPGECDACHEAQSPVLLHEPQARALAGYARMFTLRRTIRRSRPYARKADFAPYSFSAENDNSPPPRLRTLVLHLHRRRQVPRLGAAESVDTSPAPEEIEAGDERASVRDYPYGKNAGDPEGGFAGWPYVQRSNLHHCGNPTGGSGAGRLPDALRDPCDIPVHHVCTHGFSYRRVPVCALLFLKWRETDSRTSAFRRISPYWLLLPTFPES